MTKAAYRGKFVWVLEGQSVMLGEAWHLAAACYLEQKLRALHTVSFRHKAERATTIGRGLKRSKPHSSDVPPPARPHFLNLPREGHQLGAKCSDV